MRKLIVLQDIDHLGYPFDRQYYKFLSHIYEGKLSEKFTEEMIIEYKYLEDYLWSELEKGPKPVLDTLMAWHPEMSRKPNEFIEEYFYKKLREFGKTDYFVNGAHNEIREMNRHIKRLNPNAKVIALTARGREDEENHLYDYCLSRTVEWIKNERMEIDDVFLSRTADKHKLVDKILERENVSVKEIVFFAEDRIDSLPKFMERGINCIMLTSKNDFQRLEIERVKASDKNGLLHIAYSHAEVRDLGIKLFEEKMKES